MTEKNENFPLKLKSLLKIITMSPNKDGPYARQNYADILCGKGENRVMFRYQNIQFTRIEKLHIVLNQLQ